MTAVAFSTRVKRLAADVRRPTAAEGDSIGVVSGMRAEARFPGGIPTYGLEGEGRSFGQCAMRHRERRVRHGKGTGTGALGSTQDGQAGHVP
jgi:hypothetical protein